MRVVLAEINGEVWGKKSVSNYKTREPIGIEYIGAFLKEKGHDVKISVQGNNSSEHFLKSILDFKPDVVGFSVMTYNFPSSKVFAKRIKEIYSKTYIVFGGYHPSADPSIVADENIDVVVIGEGELTFADLLQTLESGGNISTVKGIAFWNGNLRITDSRERIEKLDDLPSPLRNYEILKECKDFGPMYPPSSKQQAHAIVLYGRGCSNNCYFCASRLIWNHKVIYRNPRSVVKEIKKLQEDFNTNYILFADLNFTCSHDKVYQLCDEIKKENVQINWHVQSRVSNLDYPLLLAMRDSGCQRISLGIESVNNNFLNEMNKEQTFQQIKQAVDIADSVGLITRGSLLIGYPRETNETYAELKIKLKELLLDEVRIAFLTPFPGTALFEKVKKEDLLLTEDFSKYTTDEPIIKTSFSYEKLKQNRLEILRFYYSSKEYLLQIKNKIQKRPVLKRSYEEFFNFLTHLGVLK